MLATGLAELLIIEEGQGAQAFPLVSYPATDAAAILVQELGSLVLQSPIRCARPRRLDKMCLPSVIRILGAWTRDMNFMETRNPLVVL